MIPHEFYRTIAEQIAENGGEVPAHLVEAITKEKTEKKSVPGNEIKRAAKNIAIEVMYGYNQRND